MTEKRFKDVIERMSQYKHAYILIECNYDQMINYPIGSDVPKKLWGKIKISPSFIMKFITELSVYHNIHVIFCGSARGAEKTALSIMKRVYDKYVTDKE
jgi:hypothetical protein